MEIAFESYKKISFNSYFKYENPQAFIDVIAVANPPELPFQVKFFWANGVLFRVFSHPPTEALAKEVLSGHVIFDHIEFAPMPKFVTLLDIPNRPLGKINIINVTNHTIFEPLTAWIKENLCK
jgi:hypothetical protein